MSSWKFHVDTYGCKVNQYESEAIAEAWMRLGGERCQNPADADFIIVNSCAITAKAERDARNAVYRFRREAPKARIILAGCAAQFFSDFQPRKKAIWAAPDYCLAQKDKTLLLAGPGALGMSLPLPQFPAFSITAYNRGRPVVKIQDGCSQNCAYCIVPQTRGKPRSYPPDKILAEMRSLLEAGFSELVISGINLRQYARDRPEYGDFWRLLFFLDRELADFHGNARLRVSSLEPGQLSEKNIEILSGLKLVCPHIHLSLQHASPEILKKMGRGHYNCEDILKSLELIKKIWPVFGLGADIIAGFPGETEADLKLLLDFIDAAPFTYAHVFPFSARQGTRAQSYPGQIIQKEKRVRAALVREKLEKKRNMFWKSLLGTSMRIAPDLPGSVENGAPLHGVNEYYAPCHFVSPHQKENAMGLVLARAIAVRADGLEIACI